MSVVYRVSILLFSSLFCDLYNGGNFNRIQEDYYRKLSLCMRIILFLFLPLPFFTDRLILLDNNTVNLAVNIDNVVCADIRMYGVEFSFYWMPSSGVSVIIISDDNKQSVVEHVDSFLKWAEE